jgi:Cu-Zn family superoxide dismutase
MTTNEAICVLWSKHGVKGHVKFKETKRGLRININAVGLKPGPHGFHIHRSGNLLDSCTSVCDHFNPTGSVHGGRNSHKRHLGDLGNIVANNLGEVVNQVIYDKHLRLWGKYGIVGRSVVIHADPDDLGRGGIDDKGHVINKKVHKESLLTGNAGKRLACGVIGIK